MRKEVAEQAERVARLLVSSQGVLACAESCTGGALGSCITAIPGSSSFFTGGIISYSNEMKKACLGVQDSILSSFGAVSEQCAEQMALGALRLPGATISAAITGIAGPTGGSDEKPVGLVYIAVADKDGTVVRRNLFCGSRDDVRAASVMKALEMLEELICSRQRQPLV